MRKDGAMLMGLLGVAMVVGFFLNWLDLGAFGGISGYEFVKMKHGVAWTTKLFLVLLPLGGALLAFAGFSGSRSTPLIAMSMGIGILGYTLFKLAWNFIQASGIGLFIVLGAAVL